MASYLRYGIVSNAWDSRVLMLITNYADSIYAYRAPSNYHTIVETNARELLDDRCSDPFVKFMYLHSLERQKKDEQAQQAAIGVLEELKERKYSSEILLRASFCLSRLYQRTNREQERQNLLKGSHKYLAMMAAEPWYANGRQRYVVDTFIDNNFETNKDFCVLVDEFARVKNPDPWIKLYVEGWYAIKKAWEARGKGWADAVTADGWRSFDEQLKVARSKLVKAHALHPEFPHAATRMITVAMGGGDDESVYTWFNRAVKAQMDHGEAYDNLEWALRPRWGGSHEEMYSLGVKCIETERYDTEVPGEYLDIMIHIAGELENWRDAFDQPRVRKDVQTFFTRRLATGNYWKTQHLIWSWATRDYAAAKKLMDELGPGLDSEAFARFGCKCCTEIKAKQRDVVAEIAACTSDVKTDVAKAEMLYRDNQNTNAIPLFSRLCDHFKANLNALKFAKHRLVTLQRKKDFEDGKWVNILPDGSLNGWTWYYGEYYIIKKQFRIVSDAVGVKFVCDTIITGDYEIQGVVDSGLGYVGISIGYRKHLTPRAIYILLDPSQHNVRIIAYGAESLKTSADAKVTSGPNKLRVKVKDEKISVYINDQLAIENFALDNHDSYSTSGKIAIRNSYQGIKGVGVTFKELKIRKLADEDK